MLLSALAPLSYAVLLLLLAGHLIALPIWTRIGTIALGASAVLLLAFLASPTDARWPTSPLGWAGVFGLVAACGFVPQWLTTLGVPMAGADRGSIGGGIELLTSLAVGWIVLLEKPHVNELAGALCILGALVVARRIPTPGLRRASQSRSGAWTPERAVATLLCASVHGLAQQEG